MRAFLVLFFGHVGLSAGDSTPATCPEAQGHALIQRQTLSQSGTLKTKASSDSGAKGELQSVRALHQSLWYRPTQAGKPRTWQGKAPVASQDPCTSDGYDASSYENEWSSQALVRTGETYCDYIDVKDAEGWVQQNENGNFDPRLFSKVCRKGKVPQFIEPLAGLLRDPRFGCFGRDPWQDVLSVDWIVFPDAKVLTDGATSRFFDAGGSLFGDALHFLLDTYSRHGIVFDEVYVWEHRKQGSDTYWKGIPQEARAFWEPRLKFFDGIGVSADKDSEHNPVSRIFKHCAPQDFCAFKLDIDTPQIETPLVRQLLDTPAETQAKLDEFFFEHHVKGEPMRRWWGDSVDGNFEDSYRIFGDLRKLGVRAHSWV